MEADAWEHEAAERRRSRIHELVVEAQKNADKEWGKGEWTAIWVDDDKVQPNKKRRTQKACRALSDDEDEDYYSSSNEAQELQARLCPERAKKTSAAEQKVVPVLQGRYSQKRTVHRPKARKTILTQLLKGNVRFRCFWCGKGTYEWKNLRNHREFTQKFTQGEAAGRHGHAQGCSGRSFRGFRWG